MSPKQRDVLKFIVSYWERFGCSPTYQMIATCCLTSKSGVHRMVQALVKHGHVKVQKGMHRSIRAIKQII